MERELRDHGNQALVVLVEQFATLVSTDELEQPVLQFN